MCLLKQKTKPPTKPHPICHESDSPNLRSDRLTGTDETNKNLRLADLKTEIQNFNALNFLLKNTTTSSQKFQQPNNLISAD